MLSDIYIVMLILGGIGYSLLTVGVQYALTNMKRVYELQGIMQIKTKELNELAKKDPRHPSVKAKQDEVMQLASESMKNQTKPMLVLFPVSLAVFYVILPWAVPGIHAPPLVPVLNLSYYQGLFIVTSIIFNIVITRVMQRRLVKKEEPQLEAEAAKLP
ncbi:MAG: DUF106 domain-containing protein [Candidatus Micrarchaeota archaeon]|nr:DUF106 domain-containing protein [Candidatus Micrarchaeota archaeon]MDE1804714.1 DUF106 domain-containing protein [Candidatus Micrarchaeota archaeon]MDE1847130.1 DUF106 domain-containing protein [Candidatus Micrarchaeota archaeon]